MFSMELKAEIPFNNIKMNDYVNNEYDNDLDDGRSVISDVCAIFADTENLFFLVSGFGDENWPVDCRFDLPVIIEQLPDIINKIDNKDFNFQLDFYEQGIEREIIFIDAGDLVYLECISRNGWVPETSKIEMKKENVSTMFLKFYKDFMLFSEVLCNDLANHHLFKEWLKIR